ncbi:Nonaspanin TM9SF [Mycena rebaudengoi]|nr:Nonaspanin TM9SF [Mycena rebaudengoi]
MASILHVCITSFLLAGTARAFYLPGAAPRDFQRGDDVPLFVNALTPFLGNDNSKLVILRAHGGPEKQPESLGSILFGDRIFNSPYDIKMLEHNGTCQTLCVQTGVTGDDAKFINDRIREDYALNWLIDGLPAAEMKRDVNTGDLFFDMGFNLGNNDGPYKDLPALNNHYEIVLRYHTPAPGKHRVVGVLVWPSSIGGAQEGTTPTCDTETSSPLLLTEDQTHTIRYTYRVTWNESDTPWATRWDNYLKIFDPRIHWFSLVNSLVIVLFLCVMVSMILLRSVSRDISRYNAIDLSEDWGWKLVHGEVFRTPRNPMVLAVMAGNGAQLCSMVGVTLVFALLGFLSPSNRGSLATVMMICYSFFGGIGGYVSSRVYASLGGTERKKNVFMTATCFTDVSSSYLVAPVSVTDMHSRIIFSVVFLLNLFLLGAGSSGAVPFGTMLLIVLMWFGISAPLSAIGAYFGSKHGCMAIQHPVRVHQIPRQIPPAPKYLQPWVRASILVRLWAALFASRAYYAFGFLALTAGIVGLTTATVTILFTYFILCAEEYRWHWRAFLTGGGSAFWLLAYGLFFWASRLSLHSLSSAILYLGYLLILVLLDFLITGTIGFLASYWAVRRLYSAIRID